MSTIFKRCTALFLFVLLALAVMSTPTLHADTVEPTPTLATGDELIQNGSFEIDSDHDRLPDSWQMVNRKGDKTFCRAADCFFRFKGTGLEKRLEQDIAVSGVIHEVFTLSVDSWGKRWNGEAAFRLWIYYDNGMRLRLNLDLHTGEDRQRSQDTKITVGSYHKLKVEFVVRSLSGRLWVDNASLIRRKSPFNQ